MSIMKVYSTVQLHVIVNFTQLLTSIIQEFKLLLIIIILLQFVELHLQMVGPLEVLVLAKERRLVQLLVWRRRMVRLEFP